jgi:adenylate kinase family enzyme
MSATRILVYGVTGSGKTTLAAQIAERTGLPWHDVDELTWATGWVEVPHDEQRRRIRQICEGECWILDTAYAIWSEIPLARVDLVVALDFPRWVSFSRLLRRTAARVLTRRPVCNGNVETLRQVFGRESILAWHVTSFPRKRANIEAWSRQVSPEVVRLTSPRATREWLETLSGY